jgi:hypothetical protein
MREEPTRTAVEGCQPDGVSGGRLRKGRSVGSLGRRSAGVLGSRRNGGASGRVTGIAMVQTAEAGKGDDLAEFG